MNAPDLSLYMYRSCPFCIRVCNALTRLGLDVELRNVRTTPAHLDALMAACGRPTVPVLRIDGPDGESTWMPESADIVAYLEARFGASAATESGGLRGRLGRWWRWARG